MGLFNAEILPIQATLPAIKISRFGLTFALGRKGSL
jgi:hypothetical protein